MNFGRSNLSAYFKPHNPIGRREIAAVKSVVKTGELSKFIGAKHPNFLGGTKVQEFENNWKNSFAVNHAISVNSATSGLIAALGSVGIEPGDEVITTPWTMSATATSIVHWCAIPVFADIDPRTFCISPDSIESKITSKTKAIIAVDIFGQSCDMNKIMEIAHEYNLKVISDTSQAPGATYNDLLAGTIADIGVYSLNYHKHIHTGEGGMVVTNDHEIAEKVRLIRNHAEAVIEYESKEKLANMIGYNFRMGEMEAAIGVEQLKKLKSIVEKRQELAIYLNEEISRVDGVSTPYVPISNTHSYYVYPLVIDSGKFRVNKLEISEKLKSRGIQGISPQYQNLHLLPIFQKKIAYGIGGFPWTTYNNSVDYSKGICPNAEELQDKTYIGFNIGGFEISVRGVKKIAKEFVSVFNSLNKRNN
jgi:perosamine synthetase